MNRSLLRNLVIVFLVLFLCAPALLSYEYPKEGQDQDIGFYSPPRDVTTLPLSKKKKVKNIIYMIGDGMGVATVDAARIRAAGAGGRLYMECMPIAGLVKTHSNSRLVTDSAAAGTALSTGVKTTNEFIGVNPEQVSYQTILEGAQTLGKAVGIVATSSITHATPASFASHLKTRKGETEIAEQLLKNKVNVLLGGGKQFFLPQSSQGSKRKDDRNLISEAQSAGYMVIETGDDLDKAKGAYVLGLFQMKELTTFSPEPTLAELTLKAIDLLKTDKDGFFLMVEGSKIDWANHDNNADYSIRQTLLFDQAVYVALDFAQENTDTLVLVTADHETGGMAINEGSLDGKDLDIRWTTKDHTGVQVPVYAFGPQALLFTGVQDNTQIPAKMARILKIQPFPQRIKESPQANKK